jgi:4-aminobutyrate aminotransferase
MIGVEFDTPEHAEAVQWAAFQRGLLVLEAGHKVIRMSPALTVSHAEMETALRIFAESVAEVAARPEAAVAAVHAAAERGQLDEEIEAAV